MRLSIYTAVKNGIANDLHVEAMIRHHLALADEIIVNEGYSTDQTLKKIKNIHEKVKIFQSEWEVPKNIAWCIGFKDAARRACTGDWCIHLDCDEFIPEWEFAAIRSCLEMTKASLIPVRFINFYGSHRVYHCAPERVSWPARKMIIHRNVPEVEFWGDGSNVRIRNQEFCWDATDQSFTVHHFGMVRDPAILRSKWWLQGRAIAGKRTIIEPPKWVFRLFPHDWFDPEFFSDLRVYGGPDIKAVRDNPEEFVRDGMKLAAAIRGGDGSGQGNPRPTTKGGE